VTDRSGPALGVAKGLDSSEAKGLVRNMSWSTLGTAARILIAGGALALVSRQVTATEMGLYGIGWAGASLGYTISLNGAAQSIIAVPNMERGHLGAAQFLSLLIGLITAAVLIVVSPFATAFYHSADMGHAVVIGALFVPLMCLGAVDVAQAQKSLQFSKLALVQTAAVVLAGITSLLLAYAGQGLLALFALQGLIGFYVFLVARFVGLPMGLHRFGMRHLADILSVGVHLSLGSLTGALWLNMPQLLIGRVASVEVVGLYVFCSRIVQLVFTQLSGMINNVIYPTFAQLRDNPAQVGASFLQTVRFTYFCLNAPLLMLAAAPKSFLVVYGGGKWAAGSTVLLYLAFSQMILALGANVFPTFAAMGRPSVAWRWNLFISVFQGLGIVVAAPYGIAAVVQSLAITALVMPLAVWWLSKVALFRMRDYARNMAPIVLAVAPAILVGQMVEGALHLPPLVVLAGAAGAAISLYAGLTLLMDASLRQHLLGLVGKHQLRNRSFGRVRDQGQNESGDRPSR